MVVATALPSSGGTCRIIVVVVVLAHDETRKGMHSRCDGWKRCVLEDAGGIQQGLASQVQSSDEMRM